MTQKIRLRLTAYDVRVLDRASDLLVTTAREMGSRTAGPIPLPTSLVKQIFQDQPQAVELRTHKRIVDILDPSQRLMDLLMRLPLPAGVSIEIKS
jgi:small subunit ribosomal protein S10